MDRMQMRCFLAVVERGTITAAAGDLGAAIPTVSHTIRSLERALGIPLFDRVGRGMVPTAAARALIGPARRLVRDFALMDGVGSGAAGVNPARLRGHLDLSVHPGVDKSVPARLVAFFRQRHPDVSITISTVYDEHRIPTLLREEVCELVLCLLAGGAAADPAFDPLDGLAETPLGVHEYWIAYPPDAQPPPHDPITWSEVDVEMVEIPRGGTHADAIFTRLSPAQRARRPAVVLQNRESRLAYTVSGAGATWIERRTADDARRRGAHVRALTPALTAPYGLVYIPERLSPAAAALIEIARSHHELIEHGDERRTSRGKR